MPMAQPRREEQVTIRTKRLILRLADPSSPSDCQEILRVYNDPDAAKHSVSGIKTVADVQLKHERHGPRSEYCTLSPAPRGMFFLVYIPSISSDGQDESSPEVLIGQTHFSCRAEMPCPDFGYAIFAPYQGLGYATEAGQAALQYWRDTVGVKEIFIGTAPSNIASQKLAERLGFVRAGTFDVLFGHPPNESKETGGLAYVLPGMKWTDGHTMKLTVGASMLPREPDGEASG